MLLCHLSAKRGFAAYLFSVMLFCGFAALVFLCASVSFTQSKKSKPKTNGEKLITALIDAEGVSGVYGDDGMYIFVQAPAIQRIFRLKAKAIPLLIAHLDDKRLLRIGTNFTNENGNRLEITVGMACFDLQTLMIRHDSRFFDKKCLEEEIEGTIGSCARKKYLIEPFDFWPGEKLRVTKRILRAKRNWQTAYKKGRIRYTVYDWL